MKFFKCDQVVLIKDLKEHCWSCPHAVEVCEYCKQFIPREEVQNHSVSCPEMKRHCPLSDIEYFLDIVTMMLGNGEIK